METEQPKKKGGFWKTLLKVVTLGLVVGKILAEDNVIRGTGGDVLKKVDPDILKDEKENYKTFS